MRVAVFTPTMRWGGLDVLYGSICRQLGNHEIIWLLADELSVRRKRTVKNRVKYHEFQHFQVPKTGYRNLAASYNEGVRRARKWGAELFVSAQDYLWMPDDGVDRFVKLAEQQPNGIYTGLCSHSADPGPEQIVYRMGHWSLFASDFTERPQTISWADCRGPEPGVDHGIAQCSPVAWEANWAAIGPDVLYNEEVYWDEAYDRGVAYENQDLAMRAQGCGHPILLDSGNHSIALPHRAYFPWQEEEDVKHINQSFHEERWQI